MRFRKSLRYFVPVLVLLFLMPVASLQVYGQVKRERDHSRHRDRARRYSRTAARYTAPDVTLVDMRGERVRLSPLLEGDSPVILQFIFTTCTTICPAMAGTFSAVQKRHGAELGGARMISISIDPEVDTPPRLREYARKFDAGPGWIFLTGSLEDVVAVQKAFDAYRGNKMRHEPATYMRVGPGRDWVRFDGLMSAKSLVEEYRGMLSR